MCVEIPKTPIKTYFTAEEMHTPEYTEYVKWMSAVWKKNYEINNKK